MLKHTILFAAVVGLVLALAQGAQAGLVCQLGRLDLTADYGSGAGNNPGTGTPWAQGDAYHLIFVTSTTRNGDAWDMATYNTFVNTAAAGSTYAGVSGVTWYAVCSVYGSPPEIPATDVNNVNARDNAAIVGPVFRLDSAMVGTGYADFWDGTHAAAINLTELGTTRNTTVYGGTDTAGVANRAGGGGGNKSGLGGKDNALYGNSVKSDFAWVNVGTAQTRLNARSFYGLSETLHIVPEPAALALLGLGGLGLGLVLDRKRRSWKAGLRL